MPLPPGFLFVTFRELAGVERKGGDRRGELLCCREEVFCFTDEVYQKGRKHEGT